MSENTTRRPALSAEPVTRKFTSSSSTNVSPARKRETDAFDVVMGPMERTPASMAASETRRTTSSTFT